MDIEARLDQVARRAIGENRIVGTVLLVRQHGHVVCELARGLADREAQKPMAPDAIFRLSSLTKPIVAATVLALVDAGALELEQSVAHYLPGSAPRTADDETPTITLHHLLTHTSGLGSAPILTDAELAAGVTRADLDGTTFLDRIFRLPLQFDPGTAWAYGFSTDVLGAIVAKVTGLSLEQAIRQYVADPLGMADTRFFVTHRERLATAYADSPDGAVLMGDPHSVPNQFGGITTYDPGRIFRRDTFQSGGGGMAGTGHDMMTLLETLRTGGGAILRPETVALGLANQTPQLAYSQSPGWGFSYFGAWLDDPALARSPAARGTNRWGGIYGHNWFIDVANGLTVVSMSNTGLEGCDGAYKDEVRDAVYAGL